MVLDGVKAVIESLPSRDPLFRFSWEKTFKQVHKCSLILCVISQCAELLEAEKTVYLIYILLFSNKTNCFSCMVTHRMEQAELSPWLMLRLTIVPYIILLCTL